MTTVDGELFGRLYASWYDRWHDGKDYAAEVSQLSQIMSREARVDRVLDLGCGTGQHLELLAEAGHTVLGVDRSPVMVQQARARLARYRGRASVLHGDLLDVQPDEPFDAVLMMYSVLGYQVDNEALLGALAVVHRAVRPAGLFLFDVLDAIPLLRRRPRDDVGIVDDLDHQLLRATSCTLLAGEQAYEFAVRLWLLRGGRLVEHAEERHRVRFFLRRELELLLAISGFRLLGAAPLAGSTRGPNRLVWARRI
ncbi:class I SAM-dependent methyltransferase [Kutzneria buriramensis]|uniref:Methyltransferase family protein n=1 Tax=Kutzneria buriramensis TaxID=1045776 RepID=A0A3E0GU52_9PSEU|nr:class I SAM-dependent methyltransferase [Kutzneria buriramensis]REH27090.1 methyltransferase family protein [Kutzneria buriramensis]